MNTARKIGQLLVALFMAVGAFGQNSSVFVSDTTQSTPCFLQFANSHLVMAAVGVGKNLQTHKLKIADRSQQWYLIGTEECFQMLNAQGLYVAYAGSMFQASNTPDSKGFMLVRTANGRYADACEIRWLGAKSEHDRLNQCGGTGVGVTLALWSAGDVNNACQLVPINEVEAPEYLVLGRREFHPEHPLTLWYQQPATSSQVEDAWMEYALPIGNGQFGACLMGGVKQDEIQFNEKTLWEGTAHDMGSTSQYGSYKNFGSVLVRDLSDMFGTETGSEVRDYVRYLDIQTGVGGVCFSSTDSATQFDRRYFASHPDSVVVACYRATGVSALDLLFSLKPGADIGVDHVTYTPDGYAFFSGKLRTVSHNACLRVIPRGSEARIERMEQGLRVYGTQEILVVLGGGTDYDAYSPSLVSGTNHLSGLIRNRVNQAASRGWQELMERHLEDFTDLQGRVDFQIEGAATNLPTDSLVNLYNNPQYNVTGREPDVLFLEQLYFAYGRYLMIGSSRGVDLPSNLQGIWNNRSFAAWNSDIHSNINVQMNYWPAEPTNLSELHMPFINYVINMAGRDNWKRAATEYGGVKNGWTCFTENNIFGGMSLWGNNYFVANAWYCSHIWQHYRYTLDEDFLLRAFPTLWSCAQFWMERMIEDRGCPSMDILPDGTFVAPDEFSAEQGDHPKEDGTAHAQQLIYSLLSCVRQSVDILSAARVGITQKDLFQLDHYLQSIDRGLHTELYTANEAAHAEWTNPRFGVNKGDTLLREWKYATYDVSRDPSHRHLSHLMALYPLSQIGPRSPYFHAAVNSLRLRGDKATGWSMGWKVCLWARALEGNHAHAIIHNALKHSTGYDVAWQKGGVYYNLFDSHAPFQIDGNFGTCAGIAEMLLQSHTDTLQLLPALPDQWPSGHILGLRAVNNFQVDQYWQDGHLQFAVIRSYSGKECPVTYPGIDQYHVYGPDGKEMKGVVVGHDMLLIPTEQGCTYTIRK
ncbi:MAG: glycosyl hydrolase family 95 catalytic domain-containing protein [Bacteroidaceae bacterium]